MDTCLVLTILEILSLKTAFTLKTNIVSTIFYFYPAVVGWHAGLVRSSMPRQCEVGSDHVGTVGPGDPARDWHLEPTSPPQAAPGHPGDGVPHLALRPSHFTGREHLPCTFEYSIQIV